VAELTNLRSRRPRKIPTSPRSALALAIAAAAVAGGCGGHARQAEPQLARGDAAQLVSLARRVAQDAPTDGCAAKRDIAALSAKAHALVASGRVPVALRARLLAGVAAVEADAPACTPPAPAPAPAPVATPAPAPAGGHGKGHDKHKDHGHGRGHGHGHDEDQDEG
jgi:hypothetical protein